VRDGGTGGAGRPCTSAATCFSGSCVHGNCQAGSAGAPCENGGDCISGQCSAQCACAAGGPMGAGSPCVVGNQCLSGSCTNGVCDPSGRGSPCRVPIDCQPTLMCANGVCT
jgi:hypothetical protein